MKRGAEAPLYIIKMPFYLKTRYYLSFCFSICFSTASKQSSTPCSKVSHTFCANNSLPTPTTRTCVSLLRLVSGFTTVIRITISADSGARDFKYICRGLRSIYAKYGTMETLFVGCSVWDGIERLRGEMAAVNGGVQTKHISNPVAQKGKPASACKRMHMMLRWLCRKDGVVDLGIWNSISPAELMIPLDVHVARTARLLGLVIRKQNDRKTVEELTAQLRKLSPDDPVKYDFALFGVGEAGDTFMNEITNNTK